jgi:hypothetical protein
MGAGLAVAGVGIALLGVAIVMGVLAYNEFTE